MYAWLVPKLWTDTIEAHRRAVHDATLDTTAALVAEHGLAAVTMSQIAAQAGIGRATLYKYFPDVEAILVAWHDRQIARHLDYLAEIRDRAGPPASGSKPSCGPTRSFSTSIKEPGSPRSCTTVSASPGRSGSCTASSATCWPRASRPATSGMTWRPANLRSTACTP